MTKSERVRATSRVVLSMIMATAGVAHFAVPRRFEAIVPPQLPAPHLLVLVSGVCEVALAVLLLAPKTRRLAGWGLVALYVAVFPANIHMALAEPSSVVLWVRLPFQFVLIAWALWVSRPAPRELLVI
jgi:uncharacterized membrane protein